MNVSGRIPPLLLLTALATLLVAAMLFAAGSGAYALRPSEVLAILLQTIGIDIGVPVTEQQSAVLLQIRLPRVLLAVLTGGGLALGGAALQALFRNPLADPTLIGVSAGAAVAAAGVITLGATVVPGLARIAGIATLPIAAFIGGLAVTLLVYRMAQVSGQTSLAVMLLAGIAMNALAFAGVGFFTFVANDEQLRNIAFWNLGSLGAASWPVLAFVAPCVLAGCAFLAGCAKPFNALALGEIQASHLGFNVERVKLAAIVCAALVVGALTAITGIINFVGLVAPHMVRLAGGPDHRVVLPGSVLLGGTLVTVSDVAARTLVAPAEMPIGIVTAFLGVPVFLILLARSRRDWRI